MQHVCIVCVRVHSSAGRSAALIHCPCLSHPSGMDLLPAWYALRGCQALTLDETPAPSKIARLYLMNDILYNSSNTKIKVSELSRWLRLT